MNHCIELDCIGLKWVDFRNAKLYIVETQALMFANIQISYWWCLYFSNNRPCPSNNLNLIGHCGRVVPQPPAAHEYKGIFVRSATSPCSTYKCWWTVFTWCFLSFIKNHQNIRGKEPCFTRGGNWIYVMWPVHFIYIHLNIFFSVI